MPSNKHRSEENWKQMVLLHTFKTNEQMAVFLLRDLVHYMNPSNPHPEDVKTVTNLLDALAELANRRVQGTLP